MQVSASLPMLPWTRDDDVIDSLSADATTAEASDSASRLGESIDAKRYFQQGDLLLDIRLSRSMAGENTWSFFSEFEMLSIFLVPGWEEGTLKMVRRWPRTEEEVGRM